MLKVCGSLCVSAILILLMVTPVAARAVTVLHLQIDSPNMLLDGAEQQIDDQGTVPLIVDGRAVVPLRPVIEALGGTVLWDYDLRLLTVRDYLGKNEIILKINSYDSVVNARTGPQLDVAPVLANSVTMVPILFISYHLGYEIEWDDYTRTITITRNYQEPLSDQDA